MNKQKTLLNFAKENLSKLYKYDAVVVLAGGIKDDGQLPDTVLKRIERAVELYRRGYAPLILMSGQWSSNRSGNVPPITEAESMARYAFSLGVSPKSIIKEEQSNNTESNVLYIQKLFLEPNGWKKIVVVTSDFHMPRVQFLFRRILGSQYLVDFKVARTQVSNIKHLRWRLSEMMALFIAKKKYLAMSRI